MTGSDRRVSFRAAQAIQAEADRSGLGIRPVVLYDRLIKDQALRRATRQLFFDGHYSMAVEEAYKCLNNTVKSRSGLTTDGASLMNTAFSPGAPVLRLSPMASDSDRNKQLGYMQILAGCMVGIRNPRAHEHAHADAPDLALELLVWANHLMRVVQAAKRARSRQRSVTK